MAKNAFLTKLQYENAIKTEREKSKSSQVMRQMALDFATITLGVLDYTPEQIKEFRDTFEKVEKELAVMVKDDSKTLDNKNKEIHNLVYSKDKIDQEIKRYVPPEEFLPWDERYAKCYE